ncbi:MAG TPA: ComF family protein, partial [Candidatus Paceibacterota bacterium]|nr:ComF family protein [Candidatus Paceibacterota bacterium]
LGEQMSIDESTSVLLIPIPPSKTYKIRRGFNQAHLIATIFSTAIPHAKVVNIVTRVRNVAAQSSIKKKSARLRNMEGAFAAAAPPHNHTVAILVDDIITTGATMEAARKALKAAGWKTVYGFAVAYTPLREK